MCSFFPPPRPSGEADAPSGSCRALRTDDMRKRWRKRCLPGITRHDLGLGISPLMRRTAWDMRILCAAPQAETPAVWLGDACGGLHIEWACAQPRRRWRLCGVEALFWSISAEDLLRPQGRLGGTRPGPRAWDGLFAHLIASVKTLGEACGRTTPLQAAQACCLGDDRALPCLPPLWRVQSRRGHREVPHPWLSIHRCDALHASRLADWTRGPWLPCGPLGWLKVQVHSLSAGMGWRGVP